MIDPNLLTDPAFIGLATMVLVEIAKRVPDKYIPLDPANKNQVKLVAGALAFLIAAVRLFGMHALSGATVLEGLKELVQLWISSWAVAHVGYQAMPFLKDDGGQDETKP